MRLFVRFFTWSVTFFLGFFCVCVWFFSVMSRFSLRFLWVFCVALRFVLVFFLRLFVHCAFAVTFFVRLCLLFFLRFIDIPESQEEIGMRKTEAEGLRMEVAGFWPVISR